MMFYAPVRGMSEARMRARLMPALLLALLTQAIFTLYTQWPFLSGMLGGRVATVIFAVLIQSASSIFFTALVFVPVTIIIASLFERRRSSSSSSNGGGGIGLAIQQDYVAFASTTFYAWAATNILALPLAFLVRVSGIQAAFINIYLASVEQVQRERPDMLAATDPQMLDPLFISVAFLQLMALPILGALIAVGVHEVFSLSWLRSVLVVLASSVVILIIARLAMSVFGLVFASPFLLLLLFFVLRGYFSEVARNQRARASFKQNLEAATLNPADASAHYNLGLIHQQRNELEAARQRFARAVEIDPDEVDAHYQLGRIARALGKLPDAITHFEQVIMHDPTHAQNEIWREVGATYLAAGQFEDAREALQRFLDRRELDPEGLYLMGRAHAGLGHRREAADSMQACIEAVKTAPAYKYRADKHWLNEAQEFIKSSQ
jgi:tetratricopeptide (TPR) repeat protein